MDSPYNKAGHRVPIAPHREVGPNGVPLVTGITERGRQEFSAISRKFFNNWWPCSVAMLSG